jgi:hypothetical protein
MALKRPKGNVMVATRRRAWRALAMSPLGAGTFAMLAVMAGAAPAQATITERGEFTFEESVEEDFCGIEVRRESTFSTKYRARTGKGDLDQAFFGMDRYRSTDTFTNLATGAFFTVDGKGVFKDVKATRVDGNVFRFTILEAGAVAVLRDMSGNILLRDRGAIWRTLVFDTLGDDEPGGEILEETADRVSGPHPLLDADEATRCALIHDLIG